MTCPCPVCDGTGQTRAVGTPGCPPTACAWCLHTGRVTETQREWLLDEAAHLYLPGRDDERLLAEFRDEFPDLLDTRYRNAVKVADDAHVALLAITVGVMR